MNFLKLVNKTELIHFSLLQQNKEDEYEPEFYVILCFDNLLEVLRSGCRRRLTKLEWIGRRLHLIIEKYFSKMPLLRLDILFETGYSFSFPSGINKLLGMLLRGL